MSAKTLQIKKNNINDDYEILQDLGEGCSGFVKCCTNKKTGEKCALKTLQYSKIAIREYELQYNCSQNCDYIVKIKDIYYNQDPNNKNACKVYLVMEYIEGGELFDKIKRSYEFSSITEQEVARIMFQLCSAVKHLHDMGVAHRDLKPENILLSSKSDDAVLKLTDFGFAKEVLKGLSTPSCTKLYAAPEIIRNLNVGITNREQYDKSCDVWSLGVIMYILCCGYSPFFSPSPPSLFQTGNYTFPDKEWSRISNEAKSLIEKMLKVDPEERIKIDDIIKSNWIEEYFKVPKTVLSTSEQLWQTSEEQINEIKDAISCSNSGNRVDFVPLRDLEYVNNPLLKRRLEAKRSREQSNDDDIDPSNRKKSK